MSLSFSDSSHNQIKFSLFATFVATQSTFFCHRLFIRHHLSAYNNNNNNLPLLFRLAHYYVYKYFKYTSSISSIQFIIFIYNKNVYYVRRQLLLDVFEYTTKKTFFYLMNLSVSVTTTTTNDHQTRITELFVILLPSFEHTERRDNGAIE